MDLIYSLGIAVSFFLIGCCANLLGQTATAFNRNVFAVSTTIFIGGLGTLIGDLYRIALKNQPIGVSSVIIIVALVLFFVASLTIDRFGSWERDSSGKNTDRKHLWRGIVLPDVWALAVLTAYYLFGPRT